VNALFEGGAHFFIFPGGDVMRANEDGDGLAVIEGVFEGFLPGLAGDEVPFVEPAFEVVFPLQGSGNRLDGGFVLAVVAEENVVGVGHLGLLPKTMGLQIL